MLVVQQETTAKYRNRFVFHPVQVLENDSASGNRRGSGVVSVTCCRKSVLPFRAGSDQDFKITETEERQNIRDIYEGIIQTKNTSLDVTYIPS